MTKSSQQWEMISILRLSIEAKISWIILKELEYQPKEVRQEVREALQADYKYWNHLWQE